RRLALAHVEGQDLLDVVLHLVEPPLDLDLTISAEYAGASRLADVQIRLPGLGLQRDNLRPERPRGHRVQAAAFQFPVAGDPRVAPRAVDGRGHLDVPRPMLRDERPLDPSMMRVGHADEAAAVQRRLMALVITERWGAAHGTENSVK